MSSFYQEDGDGSNYIILPVSKLLLHDEIEDLHTNKHDQHYTLLDELEKIVLSKKRHILYQKRNECTLFALEDIDSSRCLYRRQTANNPFSLSTSLAFESVDCLDDYALTSKLPDDDYICDMYKFYREKEKCRVIDTNYLQNVQKNKVTQEMRAVVVDWIVDVHLQYKEKPETIFLSVQLFDRYMSINESPLNELQLVACACMLISSKYEETDHLTVRNLSYISDSTYNRSQIMNMEEKVLGAIDFKVTQSNAYMFIYRFLEASFADEQTCLIANYFLGCTLLSYELLGFRPSELAAAAVFLARSCFGLYPWTITLDQESHYTKGEVASIARCVLEEHSWTEKPNLSIIRENYYCASKGFFYGKEARKQYSIIPDLAKAYGGVALVLGW